MDAGGLLQRCFCAGARRGGAPEGTRGSHGKPHAKQRTTSPGPGENSIPNEVVDISLYKDIQAPCEGDALQELRVKAMMATLGPCMVTLFDTSGGILEQSDMSASYFGPVSVPANKVDNRPLQARISVSLQWLNSSSPMCEMFSLAPAELQEMVLALQAQGSWTGRVRRCDVTRFRTRLSLPIHTNTW